MLKKSLAIKTSFLVLGLGFLIGSRVNAGDFAWIEAGTLFNHPAGFKVGGWVNRQYLSGDNWLFASIEGQAAEKLPKDGLLLSFPFEIGMEGEHEVWARVGCEFIRAPFHWRIDEGDRGQMTNGLTSKDSWKFIFYHNLKEADPHPKWSADFAREEEIEESSIIINAHYHRIIKLRLIFDDSSDYHQRVVPLLNLGALVKYRMGKGEIILNQLRIQANGPNQINGEKKQNIVARLLGNRGRPLQGRKGLLPGLT